MRARSATPAAWCVAHRSRTDSEWGAVGRGTGGAGGAAHEQKPYHTKCDRTHRAPALQRRQQRQFATGGGVWPPCIRWQLQVGCGAAEASAGGERRRSVRKVRALVLHVWRRCSRERAAGVAPPKVACACAHRLGGTSGRHHARPLAGTVLSVAVESTPRVQRGDAGPGGGEPGERARVCALRIAQDAHVAQRPRRPQDTVQRVRHPLDAGQAQPWRHGA
jgi:hypothetical protein